MSDDVVGARSPLVTRKSALAAGLLGVCLGPLGTVMTPGTKADLLVTGSVYAVSALAWGGHGMLLGLLFAGVYGAGRVARSNARIDAAERAAARAAAEMARLEAVSVLVEPVKLPAEAEPQPSPAIDEASTVVLVEPEPEAMSEPPTPVAEVEPPSPPVPPTPRKRGRPKGSGKLAA